MEKSIIGTGIFNLDIVVKRNYPQWPAVRPFEDRVVLEEVVGTCGNVMSILAWMRWNVRPIKKLLPLRKMAENFGFVRKSLRPKLGCRSYFTPEGKVALMFLKMYTGLSCPKLGHFHAI